MATKQAVDLQVGDMIYAYGAPAEVERVRLRDYVRHADGEGQASVIDSIKPGEAWVVVKSWDGGKWVDESFALIGEVELCPCKHVVIPTGEYTFRNVDTGETYKAKMDYTVGYQFEVTI